MQECILTVSIIQEKLLIMSNFTFGHNVFKGGLLILLKMHLAGGKGLFLFSNPFRTCKCVMMPLQQTAFENIVAKGEIVHHEQFLLLSQYLNLI